MALAAACLSLAATAWLARAHISLKRQLAAALASSSDRNNTIDPPKEEAKLSHPEEGLPGEMRRSHLGEHDEEEAPTPPPPRAPISPQPGGSVSTRRRGSIEKAPSTRRASTNPATARVAGQRIAVLSIVADPDGDADGNDDECLMRVLGFFDDQTECDAWVRNVASERVQDVHLDVTSSCVWICPRTMRRGADAPKECHRNNELHDIIEYHRSEPERVSEFNKHMSSTGGGRDGEGGGASSDYVRLVEEKAAPSTEAV